MAVFRNPKRPFLVAFVLATVCALGLRLFILEDFRVASGSMRPGLVQGDLIFAWKAAYNIHLPFSRIRLLSLGSPSRGDVALFAVPGEDGQTFLKRVVAVEGDVLQIKGGRLWLNGKDVSLPQVSRQIARQLGPVRAETLGEVRYAVIPPKEDYGPVKIPEGHFFALGDNRADSKDSRVWGPIPNSYLKGKLLKVWLPAPRQGDV